MAKVPEWQDLVPTGRWRMPAGGYYVTFRVVSPSYMKKLTSGEAYAISYDFGEAIPPLKYRLDDKEGRIYFNSSMDTISFLDKIQHETKHMLIEWGGRYFEENRNGR